MNHFISYPRSGRTWQERRMLLLLYKKGLFRSEQDINERLENSHHGYDAHSGPHRPSSTRVFSPMDKYYILLRDGKGVINSHFYYIHNVVKVRIPTIVQDFNIPTDIDEFSRSSFGVQRYCNYLNDVAVELDPLGVRYLHYTDAFSPDFIEVLAEMLEINITAKEKEFVFKNSDLARMRSGKLDPLPSILLSALTKAKGTARVGRPGNYKKTLSLDSQLYIDNYLKRNCQLVAYAEKYLGENND